MATMMLRRGSRAFERLRSRSNRLCQHQDGGAVERANAESVVYIAGSHPFNAGITGSDMTAKVWVTVYGNALTTSIHINGASSSIECWQHVHECVAACPTAVADVDHDGMIDLIGTEAPPGMTTVLFNCAPTAMQISTEAYRKASAKGSYETTISSSALLATFAKAFNGQRLNLDQRVIFNHEIPVAAKLPTSVASLGPIPISATLSIACGRVEQRCRCEMLKGTGVWFLGDCAVPSARPRTFVRSTRAWDLS